MNSTSDLDPIAVFSGTAWQCGLVVSLLKNAGIKAFIFYGGRGTLSPWDVKGGLPINQIMVPGEDEKKAREVIRQYEKSMSE